MELVKSEQAQPKGRGSDLISYSVRRTRTRHMCSVEFTRAHSLGGGVRSLDQREQKEQKHKKRQVWIKQQVA